MKKYHYDYEGTKFVSPIELNVEEQGLFTRVFINGRDNPDGVVPESDIISFRPVLERLLKATGGKVPV